MAAVREINWGLMNVVGREIENCSQKSIEAVSCVATASPLLFDFLQPSGMGSSGIDLVGFRFRLSYARWRNHCSDSNSNSIMANPGLLCKFSSEHFRLNIFTLESGDRRGGGSHALNRPYVILN